MKAWRAASFDAGFVATQDIDFLLDPRAPLRFVTSEDLKEETLLGILQSADRSFEITRQTFRAQNRDGFLVDIIQPEETRPGERRPLKRGRGFAAFANNRPCLAGKRSSLSRSR